MTRNINFYPTPESIIKRLNDTTEPTIMFAKNNPNNLYVSEQGPSLGSLTMYKVGYAYPKHHAYGILPERYSFRIISGPPKSLSRNEILMGLQDLYDQGYIGIGDDLSFYYKTDAEKAIEKIKEVFIKENKTLFG